MRLLGLLLLICSMTTLAGDLTWLSQTQQLRPAGNESSIAPVFSPDGGHVLFVSLAKDLVSNHVSGLYWNVFSRDLSRGETTLISLRAGDIQPGTGHATSAMGSSNAAFVVFESDAEDLVENDANGASDIFLRDTARNTTELVSMNAERTAAANGDSFAPLISDDGRWVIFESVASSLVEGDTNGVADLFVRDRQAQVTRAISFMAMAAGPALGPVHSPSFAPGAERIAFVKTATNSNPDAAGLAEIYVYDLRTREMHWASSNLQARFGASQR